MDETTAIIVNDQGEVFIGWRSACSISTNGWEDYYAVPAFGKPSSYILKSNDLMPMGYEAGDTVFHNQPYLFSSARSAERTLKRIYGHGKLAVVT